VAHPFSFIEKGGLPLLLSAYAAVFLAFVFLVVIPEGDLRLPLHLPSFILRRHSERSEESPYFASVFAFVVVCSSSTKGGSSPYHPTPTKASPQINHRLKPQESTQAHRDPPSLCYRGNTGKGTVL
jgi:hypothetical protein